MAKCTINEGDFNNEAQNFKRSKTKRFRRYKSIQLRNWLDPDLSGGAQGLKVCLFFRFSRYSSNIERAEDHLNILARLLRLII